MAQAQSVDASPAVAAGVAPPAPDSADGAPESARLVAVASGGNADLGSEPASGTVRVTIRYFAAARAAAGLDEEPADVATPATVQSVITAMTTRHGDGLARVLTRCSYLLGGIVVHELTTAVHAGDEIDVLPPFAGG